MDTANTQLRKNVSIPVYISVILFAVSSWIDVSALYAELPLLVNQLPENWTLPSYMTITLQISNIGPLLYVAGNYFTKSKISEVPVIYLIISIGIIACTFLIPFWNKTVYFLGRERSLTFLSLIGLLSIVDCTSSVAYLSYMKRLHVQYMPAFYIGQSLCGFIPGLLGIAQGLGEAPECVNSSRIVYSHTSDTNYTEWIIKPVYPLPRFSVEVFLCCICAMLCISGISFSFLHYLPHFQKAHVQPNDRSYKTENESLMQQSKVIDNKIQLKSTNGHDKQEEESSSSQDEELKCLKAETYLFLLFITAVINSISNGIFPSIWPYSSLPYGEVAYSLVVRISKMADILVCFLIFLVPRASIRRLGTLVAIAVLGASYIMFLAFQSPSPPLQDHTAGTLIVVCTSVCTSALLAYCEVNISVILRERGPEKALMWCGLFTQVGVFCGAVTTFVIINGLHLLERMHPCPN